MCRDERVGDTDRVGVVVKSHDDARDTKEDTDGTRPENQSSSLNPRGKQGRDSRSSCLASIGGIPAIRSDLRPLSIKEWFIPSKLSARNDFFFALLTHWWSSSWAAVGLMHERCS